MATMKCSMGMEPAPEMAIREAHISLSIVRRMIDGFGSLATVTSNILTCNIL